MTCRELVSFLDDYRRGELDVDIRARFEAHLRDCAECIAYLRSYGEAVELARRAHRQAKDVADEMPDELVSAIVVAARGKRESSKP